MELLLGCGRSRQKRLASKESSKWKKLVTLDMNPDVGADIVHDLNIMPYPFEDGKFDEIHAYDVIEHLGTQGDFVSFFRFFDEVYRLLKPGGMFYCITPSWDGLWAWSDPGHTRIISEGTIHFLDQDNYDQVGKTAMTDYRHWYKSDFAIDHAQHNSGAFAFVLRKK